ncbi:hypothetical protein [Pseudomonas sp. NBRC 100443]|uniref:hypothetical protein n=1 Tax=Pseudomonas sp. NBRC 100443 TaxID=1113665 RepID=UPI0024A44C88|nr:hypothetical protein [Pseudomonas sp. NBRC 100443]GLU39692.1 hypothetical protein Pssp01_37850 [Pseudomonas sp. NBRC 100443]
MSEYQYYEFAAIDRPLTPQEMAELRARSGRAVITPTAFTNHYNWGDLNGDPDEWMRRYFDAFVYFASFASCRLSLRLPRSALPAERVLPFAIAPFSFSIVASDSHWCFNWMLDETENFDRFAVDNGTQWMPRLLPLREELQDGDLRPLYLGWLADAPFLEAEDEEPEVPPGLTELSTAQQALVEFLEIDPDLLDAAAEPCAGTARRRVAELCERAEAIASAR